MTARCGDTCVHHLVVEKGHAVKIIFDNWAHIKRLSGLRAAGDGRSYDERNFTSSAAKVIPGEHSMRLWDGFEPNPEGGLKDESNRQEFFALIDSLTVHMRLAVFPELLNCGHL